ncbi:MAG: sulfite exporter TauE/SafE family protein [Arenicella sp.]
MPLKYIQLLLITIVWSVWFFSNGIEKILDLIGSHAIIMLTMLFGSFVAGATSLGGGAVAFPVFTKLLSIPGGTALVFSLAIQSVGMTAAAFLIFMGKVPVNKKVILGSIVPGAVGVYIGLFEMSDIFSGGQVKYFFSIFSLFVAFVLVFDRFVNQRQFRTAKEVNDDKVIGMLPIIIASLMGGVISGLIGTGIDFVVFALMILFYREGLKRAVATSVCVMAINAVIGFVFISVLSVKFTGIVVDYWLAAIPIVVVGAPLGALACKYFHRDVIFYLLMGLILLDVVSTALILGKHWHFVFLTVIAVITISVWRRFLRDKQPI